MSHADVHDNSPEVENAKRWSDAELLKLGDMLLGNASIDQIARALRRDQREVRQDC